jgi:hypothetical protein
MIDLRTREGQEAQILAKVRLHGGFSIFWITETQRRACAADRLVRYGRIVPGKECGYPWCSWRLAP